MRNLKKYKYCKICILPNTRPNLKLNSNGICNACDNNNIKKIKEIKWKQRKKKFIQIIKKVKKRNCTYDCVIPVSGGKDSTWQVLIALKYKLKPLCVSWKSPARNMLGQKNLNNLINLGVDHLDVSLNPIIEKKFILKAFKKFGNPLIPMHLALHAIPVKIAIEKKIPLILWGENSAYEYGGDKKFKGYEMTNKWRKNFGVNEGKNISYWFDDNLNKRNLDSYSIPSSELIKKFKINEIFLGYFFDWSPKKIFNISKKFGFKSAKEPKTGLYKFADIDDEFLITIHHLMKWYKFGFTREWDNLSIEIRKNNISRKNVIKILKNLGFKKPKKEIDLFCKYLSIKKSKFYEIVEKHRNKKIWFKNNSKWIIKNFLIDKWKW
ncbi:MAG: N-acetyl sugar amidotransferase [Candidatus Pelagibacter sp.]|nr:N-acetyl sugar amidotransferase [Candidatus Pelagibacter sp.]OUV98137.1 MAG: hypothetical protein CBD02_01935 [Candidatus Pelagibacter sp. TMED142]